MTSRCLLLLFLAFSLAGSAAKASKTAAAAMASKTTAAAANATARLRCNYDGEITRFVAIDKKIDGFGALQAAIARFFPDKPDEFSILYALPDGEDDDDDNSDCSRRQRRSKYVDVTTDADARNFVAEYESLASASPDRARLRMKLYVTARPKPWWWGWTFFGAVSLLLQIFGGLSLFVWCIRSCRD